MRVDDFLARQEDRLQIGSERAGTRDSARSHHAGLRRPVSRIDRGNEPGTVEIYITHYGAAQLPTKTKGGSPEDWQWQATPPNPELEAEFLSRIMVRFGTPTEVAAAAVTTTQQPVAPRAHIE